MNIKKYRILNGWLCDGASIFDKCKSTVNENNHGEQARFRCTVCPDFDLCLACLTEPKH